MTNNIEHKVVSTYIQPIATGFLLFALRSRTHEGTTRLSVKVSNSNYPDDFTHQFFPSKVGVKDLIKHLSDFVHKSDTYHDVGKRYPDSKYFLQFQIEYTQYRAAYHVLYLCGLNNGPFPLAAVVVSPGERNAHNAHERNKAYLETKKQIAGLLVWLEQVSRKMESAEADEPPVPMVTLDDEKYHISLLDGCGRRGSIVNYVRFDKATKVLMMGSPRGKFTTKFSEHQTQLLKNAIADISTVVDTQITLDVESNFYIRRIDGVEGTTIKRLIINSDVFGGTGKVIFITRDMAELLRQVRVALDKCSKLI